MTYHHMTSHDITWPTITWPTITWHHDLPSHDLPSHDLPLQEIFEAVNKAYEFLCSKSAKRTEGPDPHRIVLLLQTQSILFKRYADGQPCFTA